jgi:hypothetical protein
VNNWPLNWGFLAVAKINEPNTVPIPAPAPINPEHATPAPMYFAAANILYNKKIILLASNILKVDFKFKYKF